MWAINAAFNLSTLLYKQQYTYEHLQAFLFKPFLIYNFIIHVFCLVVSTDSNYDNCKAFHNCPAVANYVAVSDKYQRLLFHSVLFVLLHTFSWTCNGIISHWCTRLQKHCFSFWIFPWRVLHLCLFSLYMNHFKGMLCIFALKGVLKLCLKW